MPTALRSLFCAFAVPGVLACPTVQESRPPAQREGSAPSGRRDVPVESGPRRPVERSRPVGEGLVADILASRTSCVSPCTVMFSAEGTTDGAASPSEVWHDVGYHFDFGDPRSGLYATTRQSRNRQIGGPLAAHTFTCDNGSRCRYRVGVRAQNRRGEIDDAFVTVVVHDPDGFYDPRRTVCVSTAGEWGGDVPCPAGAERRRAIPGPDELDRRRILLRRGERFAPFCVDYRASNVLVEPFGDARDPRPEVTGVTGIGVAGRCGDHLPTDAQILGTAGGRKYPTRWAENIALTGLRIEHVQLGMSYSHVDLHDLDMDYRSAPRGGAVSLAENTESCLRAKDLTCGRIPYPQGAYLSASTVVQSTSEVMRGGDGFGINVGAFSCPIINWVALLDNTIWNAVEHNVRTEGTWRAFFGHNDIRGHHYRDQKPNRPRGRGVRQKLTVRACGSGEIDPLRTPFRHDAAQGTPQAPMTRYTVVADNTFGSRDDFGGGVKVTLAPTKAADPEVVSYGIVERNRFLEPADPDLVSTDVILGGHALACRANNVHASPGVRQDCQNREQLAIPDRWYTPAELRSAPPPAPAAPVR